MGENAYLPPRRKNRPHETTNYETTSDYIMNIQYTIGKGFGYR